MNKLSCNPNKLNTASLTYTVEELENCYCNRTDCSSRIKDSKKYNSLQQRIDKAIKYIENDMPYLEEPDEEFERCDGTTYMTMKEYDKSVLLNILRGSIDD